MTSRREPKSEWSVVVGNIGTVYSGPSSTEAIAAYVEYREQAINNYGRAAGQSVVLMADGEVQQEYSPNRKVTLMRTIYVSFDVKEGEDPTINRACAVAVANHRLKEWLKPITGVYNVVTDTDAEVPPFDGWEEVDSE